MTATCGPCRRSSYFRGAEANAVPTANIAAVMAEKASFALMDMLGSDHIQAIRAMQGIQNRS